jgi:hypothetical protein
VKGTCKEWTKARNEHGYGLAWCPSKRKTVYAHRRAWIEHHRREIPEGMIVMHLCDNPGCINPDHLKLGTHQDNMTDKALKGRAGKKLSARQAMEIKSRLENETPKSLAEEFGVSRQAVSLIATSRAWKGVSS